MGSRKQQYLPPIFQSGGYYDEKRHGDLDAYLETHDGNSASPLFKGHAMFKRLWFDGYLVPNMSVIRLAYGLGTMDQHYCVKNLETLIGIECPGHPGLPGEHKTEDVLHRTAPCFEASWLAPLEERLKLREERAKSRPLNVRLKRRA